MPTVFDEKSSLIFPYQGDFLKHGQKKRALLPVFFEEVIIFLYQKEESNKTPMEFALELHAHAKIQAVAFMVAADAVVEGCGG